MRFQKQMQLMKKFRNANGARFEHVVKTVFAFVERVLRHLDRVERFRFKDLWQKTKSHPKASSVVLSLVVISTPMLVLANDAVNQNLMAIVAWLLDAAVAILGYFLPYAAGFFEGALQKNEVIFSSAPIVTYGWTLFRDTANMFFIIVLLVVAFATILQVESWNIKSILPRFILAILLTNFSAVLTQTIATVGNYLYRGILNAGGGSKGASRLLMNVLHAEKILYSKSPNATFSEGIGASTTHEAFYAYVFTALLTIVMLFIGIGVIFRLTIALYVRVVALWLLVMVSPIALLAYTVPSTKSYADKWAHELLTYIFLGPVAVFLYVVAVRLGLQITQITKTGLLTTDQVHIDAASIQAGSVSLESLLPQVPVLMLLWLAGSIAKKGGGMVGEAVYGAGKKVAGKLAVPAAILGATGGLGVGLGLAGGAAAYAGWKIGARPIRRGLENYSKGGIIGKTFNVIPYFRGKKAETEGQKEAYQKLDRWFSRGPVRRFISGQPESLRRSKQDSETSEKKTKLFGSNNINYNYDDDLVKNLTNAIKQKDESSIEAILYATVETKWAEDLERDLRKNADLKKLGIDLKEDDTLHDLMDKLKEKGVFTQSRAREVGQGIQQRSIQSGDVHNMARWDGNKSRVVAGDRSKETKAIQKKVADAKASDLAQWNLGHYGKEIRDPATGEVVDFQWRDVDVGKGPGGFKMTDKLGKKLFDVANNQGAYDVRTQPNIKKANLRKMALAAGFRDDPLTGKSAVDIANEVSSKVRDAERAVKNAQDVYDKAVSLLAQDPTDTKAIKQEASASGILIQRKREFAAANSVAHKGFNTRPTIGS